MYVITRYACYLTCMCCVCHAHNTHILCSTTTAIATELTWLDIRYFYSSPTLLTHRVGRAVQGMVPRQLACLDCWFESRWGHGCLPSDRDLYVGLITHPEESYRMWCVCDLGSSTARKPMPTVEGRAIRKPLSFVRYVSTVTILLSVFEVAVP